jgi:hypothetical protein
MRDERRKWLADYRVYSDMKLRLGLDKLRYEHPHGLFEATIATTPVGQHEDEVLSCQVIAWERDIEAAESLIQTYAEKFFHLMSFVTCGKFKISRKVLLIDWTPGVYGRECFLYTQKDKGEPLEVLSTEVLDTARMLHEWGVTPMLEKALRWFAAGVRAGIAEDQFQFFWFVIELIAESKKNAEKVTDKCQDQGCRGDLCCSVCGKPSRHRPFAKDAIRFTLARARLSESKIEDLFSVRNSLMHGDTREGIEERFRNRYPEFEFHMILDDLGRAAWTSILHSFDVPSGEHRPTFFQASTFVDWTMKAKVHAVIGVGGNLDDPRIEDVHLPEVKFVSPEDV